jgi:hypothetical protein
MITLRPQTWEVLLACQVPPDLVASPMAVDRRFLKVEATLAVEERPAVDTLGLHRRVGDTADVLWESQQLIANSLQSLRAVSVLSQKFAEQMLSTRVSYP